MYFVKVGIVQAKAILEKRTGCQTGRLTGADLSQASLRANQYLSAMLLILLVAQCFSSDVSNSF